MKYNRTLSSRPNQYRRPQRAPLNFISSEQREQLINLVELGNKNIIEASEILNINYSSAKSIIRQFRLTGRIQRIYKCRRQRPHLNNQKTPLTTYSDKSLPFFQQIDMLSAPPKVDQIMEMIPWKHKLETGYHIFQFSRYPLKIMESYNKKQLLLDLTTKDQIEFSRVTDQNEQIQSTDLYVQQIQL
ncbi:UNKNOWN [Stylonychia lemnae]|uniref:Uncharacterized protein n=1 Tax=Stylonychia lemnae TaxID=5949 RepID=A0A077ZU32_STYLE|nr:UNKNOWN [Stylonychia lemnae]|eukprot:CDW71966.1 UNKNOWN [Stylonychia lemnae]